MITIPFDKISKIKDFTIWAWLIIIELSIFVILNIYALSRTLSLLNDLLVVNLIFMFPLIVGGGLYIFLGIYEHNNAAEKTMKLFSLVQLAFTFLMLWFFMNALM